MDDVERLLVLGANGQVGWELCRSLVPLGEIVPVTRDSPGTRHCDLGDRAAVGALLDAVRPTVIVNAAAYTQVDRAEAATDQAYALNAALPERLAQWAAAHDACLFHFSTDYVFDGDCSRPYTEHDDTNPLNVYGGSKLAGDLSVLSSAANAWVLRVGWVYGLRGANFLLTMRRLMRERESLGIVDDQHGAPTWSRAIAEATSLMTAAVLRDPDRLCATRGVYHLSPAGVTSWFGFADEIRRASGLECALSPIASSDYPTPARRPADTLLDSSRLAGAFAIRLPHWRNLLHLCLASADSDR